MTRPSTTKTKAAVRRRTRRDPPRPAGTAVGPAAAIAMAVVVTLGPGCTRGAGDARDLAAASDGQARAVVEDVLAAVVRGADAQALARFCDQSADARQRAHDLLAPARQRSGLAILRVEPAWVGAEPFFFVEVGDATGDWRHGFGVRVRDGCLDRAVGAGAAHPDDDTVIDL